MQTNTKKYSEQHDKQRSLTVTKGQNLKKYKKLAYQSFKKALNESQNFKKSLKFLSVSKRYTLEALSINPVDADSFNLLSRIELELGDSQSALIAIYTAIELQPDNGGYWYSLGHALLINNNVLKAKDAFQKAIELSPSETRAEISLAYTYTELEEPIKAFEILRDLAKNEPNDIKIRSQLLSAASTLTSDYYDQLLEHDLIIYLNWEGVNSSLLANLTCSLLEHKFQLNEEGSAAQFEEMAKSELLQLALSNTLIKSKLLEKLIMALRYELLSHSTKNGNLSHAYIPLSNAIALYGLKSEFILPVTDAEQNMVKALTNLLDKSLEELGCMPTDISGALLLLSMYDPWTKLSNYALLSKFDDTSWPQMTFNLKNENASLFELSQIQFEAITPMPSSESNRVKSQYESFPYPRWDKLDYQKPTNYGSALSHVYPDTIIPENYYNEGLNILIAGCGTGRHALNVAKYFNHVNVTAVDLSQKSLAFASSKAKELNIKNVEFKQADLTKLETLPIQYDIVECSGVLHHIPDYKMAVKGLLKNLKPNGLIKISLYSACARNSVNQVRALFSRDIESMNNQKIKVIRQAILQGEIIEDPNGIIRSDDFYSMSGTIDLLFHQFERQFTPIDLQILCNEFQLEFLGFSNLKESVKREFLEFNQPNNSDTRNLDQWHEFEKEHPNTFSSMYQFYCQYKPKPRLKI